MTKLNQIIALTAGRKSRAQKEITEVHKMLQKPELLLGINRTYKPVDEEFGEKLPPERKQVQLRVKDAISTVRQELSEMIDIVATQDWANTTAKADVSVDGRVILRDVPVTHLLFLEKQLVDLHTFVDKFPTLDPSERWSYSEDVDCYVSEVSQSIKTKKVMKSHVKYEATKEHPAQVETYNEDQTVGHWSTVKFSGAITAKEKNNLLKRVRDLQEAVKVAREEANSMKVEQVHVGNDLLSYIFGK